MHHITLKSEMTSTKLLGFKDWILLLYLEAIYTYKEILYSFLLFCFVKLFLFCKYNISEIKGKYENIKKVTYFQVVIITMKKEITLQICRITKKKPIKSYAGSKGDKKQ